MPAELNTVIGEDRGVRETPSHSMTENQGIPHWQPGVPGVSAGIWTFPRDKRAVVGNDLRVDATTTS